MAARVESQAGGTDDGVAPSIPSAFKNKLTLSVTEAIMWIACLRHFSRETIREHLERRTLNLRRPNREPQMSPALQGRVDKAEFQLFRMIIGGVPAIGTLDHEGRPNHHERIRVPVDFLKDGAYIELLSGHIRTDPLLEKHSGHQRPTYLDVDIDRDAFFKALAAAEPRSQATDDKPIELADTSTATDTPKLDPYRTGLPGRPTIKHFILDEFQNRVAKKTFDLTLLGEAEELHNWAEKTHPDAARPTVKSILNMIRDEHRRAKSLHPKPIK